jgi:hypothetical protein
MNYCKKNTQIKTTPDLVIGPEADPLGDLPVLASLLGQDLLDLEGLVGRLHETTSESHTHKDAHDKKFPSTNNNLPSVHPDPSITNLSRTIIHPYRFGLASSATGYSATDSEQKRDRNQKRHQQA